ncbi:synembryn-A isoform X2 [Anthonomus grandis grandis]|uniref:synembryn-A isoform X2 n=1 Tax=Anthonomus grandis grandis TaxID=2921223 RepID=UPI0021661FF6|nr:synembryn-A isoform X2 [Anthonomus grandis grandis]
MQQYIPDLSTPTSTNIDNIITGIKNGNKGLYEQALVNFLAKEHENFLIEELNVPDKREQLWSALTTLTSLTEDNDVLAVVFTCFRIISRDKASVNRLVSEEWLDLIMLHTGLNDTLFDYSDDTLCKIEEGQKVLWNILFNSKEQVEAALENGVLERILDRIRLYDTVHVPDSIKYYDLKIIFYLTAVSKTIRLKVESANGLSLLSTTLKVVLKESVSYSNVAPATLDDKKTDLACEALKALFNITLNCHKVTDATKELVEILRNYLLANPSTLDKTWQLRNDVVNLLTNLPAPSYAKLLIPMTKGATLPKTLEFEGYNMIVIYEILMLLEAKFKDETAIGNQLEVYSPVLSVLVRGAKAVRAIRKYLRIHILPPLIDMDKRPEETDTLRGHLCKLLTTPITEVRDLAAELLFVLCKCNVARMVKYTGFGNAAGMFAQRGLLGMTDEQKEYETMKLVQLIDSLSKSGIIQPAKIGPDGKPHAVGHVLELQDGATGRSSDSD